MTPPSPSLPERLQHARAEVSVLAGTTPERRVRPLREATELVARGDVADPAALLDAVDSLIGLVTRAEVQLSQVERSVRDDLDRAATLSELRTSAQLASAADVAAACATAQSLLLDADSALEAVVAGYREPRAQAERHPPQTARMP